MKETKQDPLSNKKLAFIYNVRHKYPDTNNSETFNETDFDDQETISLIIKYLTNIGYTILPIEADLTAEKILIEQKDTISFALNYSEEVVGSNPKIYMAEILEKVGIPFSGCSNYVQHLIIDKGQMKKTLLTKNVPTLPFQIVARENEPLRDDLKFPVIVKPDLRGSSAGITNKSVVLNQKEMNSQILFLLSTFKEPAIVEPFIDGREFSVGMLGNPPEILPIIEPKHEKLPKDYYPIDSLEVKWQLEEELGEDYFNCPAKVNAKLKSRIEKICKDTWRALKIRDFCRIDVRMDNEDTIYVLDVNSPPGLIPPEISTTSYLPMAGKVKGYDYEKLIAKIIKMGMRRYGL